MADELKLFTDFVAIAILVFCAGGLFVVVGFSLPRAYRTSQGRQPGTPEAIFARFQLFRTVLYAIKLALFFVPSIAYFALADDGILRKFVSISALFIIALLIVLTSLTEPVAQSRVEDAIARNRGRDTRDQRGPEDPRDIRRDDDPRDERRLGDA